MNFQYKNQNEKSDTLNKEFVDMDEDEDFGFVEDDADDIEDEWDPYDDEYDDEYEDEYDEEYDDEYYNDDEWGLGDEDNSIDNQGDPNIVEHGSEDDIAEARNHYEAMVSS